MNQKQVKKFLKRKLIAKLATISEDGWPHVTPVWYSYLGSKYLINTTRDRVKFRNIIRNPKVQLLVDDGYMYVLVKGYAYVASNRDPHKDIRMLAIRYLGKEKGLEQYKNIYSKQERVSVIIEPVKVIIWP
jgi:PPOX class probable F420-dependent enzyme